MRSGPRPGLLNDRGGGAAVDFGLILPFLIVTIYVVIEFGRLLFGTVVLNFAVEQASRYAIVTNNLTCPSDFTATKAYAAGFGAWAVGWGVSSSDFSGSCSCPGSVAGANISVSKAFVTPVFLLLPHGRQLSITIGAQSCYPT